MYELFVAALTLSKADAADSGRKHTWGVSAAAQIAANASDDPEQVSQTIDSIVCSNCRSIRSERKMHIGMKIFLHIWTVFSLAWSPYLGLWPAKLLTQDFSLSVMCFVHAAMHGPGISHDEHPIAVRVWAIRLS